MLKRKSLFIAGALAALSSQALCATAYLTLDFTGAICGSNGASTCLSGQVIGQSYGDLNINNKRYVNVIYDANLSESGLQPLTYALGLTPASTPPTGHIGVGSTTSNNFFSGIYFSPYAGVDVSFHRLVLSPLSSGAQMMGNFAIYRGNALENPNSATRLTGSYIRSTPRVQQLDYSSADYGFNPSGYTLVWQAGGIAVDYIGLYVRGESTTPVNPVSPVPLPASALLFGTGLIGALCTRRNKEKSAAIPK